MTLASTLLLVLGLALAGWLAARSRAWSLRASAEGRLASLPVYHGWYVALWVFVPTILFVFVWDALSPGLVLQSVLSHPAAEGLPQFENARIISLLFCMLCAVHSSNQHETMPDNHTHFPFNGNNWTTTLLMLTPTVWATMGVCAPPFAKVYRYFKARHTSSSLSFKCKKYCIWILIS